MVVLKQLSSKMIALMTHHTIAFQRLEGKRLNSSLCALTGKGSPKALSKRDQNWWRGWLAFLGLSWKKGCQ